MEIKDGWGTYREYCRSEVGISKPWFRCERAGAHRRVDSGLGDYERSAFFGSSLSLSAIRQSSGSDAASILCIMLLR